MIGIISKVLGKDRKRPLYPEPKLEAKQMNLEDFNINDLNNTKGNVMNFLDVNHVNFERGGFYDEEE